MNGVEIAITAAGIPAECLLLAVWLYRGRRTPLWSIGLYAAYHLLFSIWMRVHHLRIRDLGSLAFIDQALDFALITSVVVEFFLYAVRPGTAMPPRTKGFAIGGLAGGISVAGLLVASLKFAGFTQTEAWNNRLDLFSSLLLCTFMLILGLATVRLGLVGNDNFKAITRALTIWAAIALVVDIFHMDAHWSEAVFFDEAVNASWTVMLVYWTYAIWTVPPPPRSPRSCF